MGEKSPQAFRTIREVADWLDVEAHVLRFWESKFNQIKPVKRAGGRRYYRPADMKLIGGIKVLLHDQGLTIRGAQKKIQDEGAAQIAALSPPLAEDLEDEAARTVEQSPADTAEADPAPQAGFVDIEALAGEETAPQDPARTPDDAEPGAAGGAPEPDAEAAPAAEADQAPESAEEAEQEPDAEPEDMAAEPPEAADDSAEEVAPPLPEAAAAVAPTTPLSEIRALLHRSVPLSPAQRASLTPLVARLEALAARMRSGRPAE